MYVELRDVCVCVCVCGDVNVFFVFDSDLKHLECVLVSSSRLYRFYVHMRVTVC